GHTPPLLLRNSGIEELSETDLLLGVVTHAVFINRTLKLEAGDSLILFTDGVSEAEDGDWNDFASSHIAQSLATMHGSPASAITKTIEDAIVGHVGDAPLADDVTLVVVSRDAA